MRTIPCTIVKVKTNRFWNTVSLTLSFPLATNTIKIVFRMKNRADKALLECIAFQCGFEQDTELEAKKLLEKKFEIDAMTLLIKIML